MKVSQRGVDMRHNAVIDILLIIISNSSCVSLWFYVCLRQLLLLPISNHPTILGYVDLVIP